MSKLEPGTCLIIALMIDGDDKKKKHVAQQQSGYREWRGSDVCQRCSGVIG